MSSVRSPDPTPTITYSKYAINTPLSGDTPVVKSEVKIVKGAARWRIINFSKLEDKANFCIFSPEFQMAGHFWKLQLFPSGGGKSETNSEGHVSLYLFATRSAVEAQQYSLALAAPFSARPTSLTITPPATAAVEENTTRLGTSHSATPAAAESGTVTEKKETESKEEVEAKIHYICHGSSKQFPSPSEGWGFLKFFPRKQLMAGQWSSMDIIEIEANVTILQQIIHTPDLRRPGGTHSSSIEKMMQDFGKMLGHEGFYDVILEIYPGKKGSSQGITIPACKAILAARSAFFMDTFENDPGMRSLVLEDCSLQDMKNMLAFLYTGEINTSAEYSWGRTLTAPPSSITAATSSSSSTSLTPRKASCEHEQKLHAMQHWAQGFPYIRDEQSSIRFLCTAERFQAADLPEFCERLVMDETTPDNAYRHLLIANRFHEMKLETKTGSRLYARAKKYLEAKELKPAESLPAESSRSSLSSVPSHAWGTDGFAPAINTFHGKAIWEIVGFNYMPERAGICIFSPEFFTAGYWLKMQWFSGGGGQTDSPSTDGDCSAYVYSTRESIKITDYSLNILQPHATATSSIATPSATSSSSSSLTTAVATSTEEKPAASTELKVHFSKEGSAKTVTSPAVGWGFLRFYSFKELCKGPWGKQNILRLQLSISFATGIDKTMSADGNGGINFKSLKGLQQDFRRLLESGRLSDIVFRVFTQEEGKSYGEEIRAHKCMLYARSPEFRAYLAANPTASVIVIEYCTPIVFKRMLNFLYTGETDALNYSFMATQLLSSSSLGLSYCGPSLLHGKALIFQKWFIESFKSLVDPETSHSIELYCTGLRFQVSDLDIVSQHFLIDTLTVQNCVKRALLAFRLTQYLPENVGVHFFRMAIKFLSELALAVKNTEQFQEELALLPPDLLTKVMTVSPFVWPLPKPTAPALPVDAAPLAPSLPRPTPSTSAAAGGEGGGGGGGEVHRDVSTLKRGRGIEEETKEREVKPRSHTMIPATLFASSSSSSTSSPSTFTAPVTPTTRPATVVAALLAPTSSIAGFLPSPSSLSSLAAPSTSGTTPSAIAHTGTGLGLFGGTTSTGVASSSSSATSTTPARPQRSRRKPSKFD